MPSDHCIIAGALVAGLWILNWRFGIIATVLAILLAFSRVYAGVHYPSDTIVGLLVGAAAAPPSCSHYGARFAPCANDSNRLRYPC